MQIDDVRNVVSIIVSIITGSITVLNFIKNRKNKRIPSYTLMTKSFIPSECGNLNDLKISYKNIDIESFSVTTFAFWNNGKKELSFKDYGKTPPYLSSDKFKILDYSMLDIYDNSFINLKEEFCDNKLSFNYNIISQNQGFVVKVLHTGKTNKDITFHFNFNNIKCKRIMLFNRKRTDIFSKLAITMFWLSSTLLIGLLIISGIFSHTEFKTLLILFCSLLLVIYGSILNIRESYIPYFGVPKRFQKYFDEIDY